MRHQNDQTTLPGRPAARNPNPGALVRELLRPEAYPGPAPSGVELRHTHASWVFLTDGEAWKVKQPVSRGSLDFSSADRRRLCCEEEVRLGRRLAPDVYRGVSPIHTGPSGHAFVGDGAVVDFAVRMRKLPDEDGANVLLAQGRLTARHVQRLAESLATFYQASPALRSGPALGRADIAERYHRMVPFTGRLIDAALLERVHRGQRELVARHEGELLDRAARGRVREGHGDLRFEHVYFTAGRADSPVVIDPLEFDDRLRRADVALDVAFLVMELEAHHRPDLTSAFLGRFASASNDFDFYPLLDLYASHRAATRAHLACVVAADPATSPAKASRKAAEADRLLALAASYL
jgi:aminoglycoside phosphotransferase family enzyme